MPDKPKKPNHLRLVPDPAGATTELPGNNTPNPGPVVAERPANQIISSILQEFSHLSNDVREILGRVESGATEDPAPFLADVTEATLTARAFLQGALWELRSKEMT